MKQENESKPPIYKRLWFWAVLFGALSLVYVIPVLIMHTFDTPLTGVQYGTVGTIGDAFGMVAPFINIIAAVFVYLAFREQLEANKKLQKQIDLDRDTKHIEKNDEVFRRKLETIKEFIDNYEYNSKFKAAGIEEVLYIITAQNCDSKENKDIRRLKEIEEIIMLFTLAHSFVRTEQLSEQEKYFTGVLYGKYFTNFIETFQNSHRRTQDRKVCDHCKAYHTLPASINKKYLELKSLYRADYNKATGIFSYLSRIQKY